MHDPDLEAGRAGAAPGRVFAKDGRSARRGRVVRERIDPRLTAALFANYRTPIDAVLELVDNAVDSRVAGHPLEVDLAVRPGHARAHRCRWRGDGTAGPGAGVPALGRVAEACGRPHRAIRPGWEGRHRPPGRRFVIVAGAGRGWHAYAFSDDAYRDRSRLRTYELSSAPSRSPRRWVTCASRSARVDRKLDARSSAPGWPRRTVLCLERASSSDGCRPRPGCYPGTGRWSSATSSVCGRAVALVRGWFGLLPDPPPPGSEPGIRLYHLGRLVGAPEWFGHPGPAMHPALNAWSARSSCRTSPVTMNKSDVDRGIGRVGRGRGSLAPSPGARSCDGSRARRARRRRPMRCGRPTRFGASLPAP